MKVLVFGGAGFVGLNIAAALLARDHAVTLFDRAGLPPGAGKDFARYGDRLTAVQGDVRDSEAVQAAVDLGAARILGMHFGTFDLADEPLDEPPQRFLAEAARRDLGDRAFVLKVGETTGF